MLICSDHALAIGIVFIGLLPIIGGLAYFIILINRVYSRLSFKFAYHQIFLAFILQSGNLDLSKYFIDHGLGKEGSVIVKTERERFNRFSIFIVPLMIFGFAMIHVFRQILYISGICSN